MGDGEFDIGQMPRALRVCACTYPLRHSNMRTTALGEGIEANEQKPAVLSRNVKPEAPMRLLVLAVWLLAASVAHSQVVYFEKQLARFEVPTGYRYGFEDGRRTLSISPEAPHHIEIRFTFNSMREYTSQRPTIGKDFVRDTAAKKGKETFHVPENGGVAFLDYSASRQIGGDRIRDTHGMMGLNDGYVTFTITAEDKYADSAAMKELFARNLKGLLGRIKSRGA